MFSTAPAGKRELSDLRQAHRSHSLQQPTQDVDGPVVGDGSGGPALAEGAREAAGSAGCRSRLGALRDPALAALAAFIRIRGVDIVIALASTVAAVAS